VENNSLLDPIFDLMVQKKASDLFIVAGRAPTLKVDGILLEISKNILTPDQTVKIVHSIMTARQIQEYEASRECQFAIGVKHVGRFRVSAFTQRDSAGMVLRRIENVIPTPEALHLPQIFKDVIMEKRGLILCVGGTGTGKSTTMASLIQYRNQNSKGHIITIEDPIEFQHQHLGCIITQREVGIDTESYEIALKNTLRQAPNVILIGEVRSKETMQNAISFAETGHLCLTTLHANNANQALDRILHFFPEEMHHQVLMDLSLNVRAIFAQQLIKRLDGAGSYPAIEILLNTPLVRDYIRKGEIDKIKEVIKSSREQGMQTFDQALFDLYSSGKISYDDALDSADSKNELRLMIKLGSATTSAQENQGMKLVNDD
jgi:twitching motility protein PilU